MYTGLFKERKKRINRNSNSNSNPKHNSTQFTSLKRINKGKQIEHMDWAEWMMEAEAIFQANKEFDEREGIFSTDEDDEFDYYDAYYYQNKDDF